MSEPRPVADAVRARRSVRAFLPTPVARGDVEELLTLASRTATNSDTQPWHVHVLTGAARDRVASAVLAAFDAGEGGRPEDPPYQPADWGEVLGGRRRAFGHALFGAVMGIDHDDEEGRRAQHRLNFDFWGAPVGMILTADRDALASGLVDAGGFLQTFQLLAHERGLGTCAQAAFTEWAALLRELLDIPENHRVVCGIALGRPDPRGTSEAYRSERVLLGGFTTFRDQELPGSP